MEVLLLLCLAITAAYGQQACAPVPSNSADSKYGNDMTDFSLNIYGRTANSQEVRDAEAALLQKIGPEALKIMKSSGSCAGPGSIGPPGMSRKCEACPTKVGYLWRFNHNTCFVILPNIQRVRNVKCLNQQCQRPCSSSNSSCRPTEWHRVWFWGWCRRPVGNWGSGLNYNYLYLSQDCTCFEQDSPWTRN